MITWILPDDLFQIPPEKMQTAKIINKNFTGTISNSLLDYAQIQTSTINRIESAVFHYQILNVAYGFATVPAYTHQDSVARAEMNAIILNLLGAFDSIANEINTVLNLKINEREVTFGHNHRQGNNNCVFCRVVSVDSTLSNTLDTIIRSEWFKVIKEYRNHIHRRLPVIQIILVVGSESRKIKLPDDPSNYNPQGNDYSKNLELQAYCRDRIDNVLTAIEDLYQKMYSQITQYISVCGANP